MGRLLDRIAEAIPAGIIDPLLWWIAMSLMAPLLLAMLECGWPRRDLFQQYSIEGAGLRRLLRGVEGLYGGVFAGLGPGALQDLKHLIDCVDGFLDLLADSKTGFRVKLMDYGGIRSDVLEFCRFYARWLGNPLMERLKGEIYELLDEAISWWGEQDVLDIMGC